MGNTEVFIALIRYVLTEKVPEIPEHACDWEELYRLGSAHKLTAMLYEAAMRLKLPIPDQVQNKLQDSYYQALSREALFEAQYECLEADFIKEGIPFIPLKGLLLKEYYPAAWMRSRADMDILIRDEDAGRVKERMEKMGYDVEVYGRCNHDVYHLEPVVSVEAHKSLFVETWESWYHFFGDVEKKTREMQKDSVVQAFSKEDNYLYIMAHMAKHVIQGGTGVRSILDAWLFWRRESEGLDLEYVEGGLEALGISVFHRRVLELGAHWMEGGEAAPEARTFGDMVFRSGMYGRMIYQQMGCVAGGAQNPESRGSIRTEKRKIIRSILFPGFRVLQSGYPILKKCPFLLPGVEVYRLGKFIFRPSKRGRVTRLMKKGDGEIRQYRAFLEGIGLEAGSTGRF